MKQRLKEALSRREKVYVNDSSRIPSAVLIPIYLKNDEYHILFTQRTEKVRDHKGQISFPGGVYEDQDGTMFNTALRESNEEIGLDTGTVELLGELDDIATMGTNYIISPFVAAIPWPLSLKLFPTEVKEIIEVPLPALLDKDCLGQTKQYINDELVTTDSYIYQGKVIWGATARILKQFLGIISQITEDRNK
ncbi:MAG: CoA pyrophosphatase [Dehalococcoidales bacterium]|nr:MAG: CoA pyrophosphatase [Dehalococcoidales bacterium]